MGNPLGAQKAIRARELVAVVSPDRKPPLYGQVFQSAAEVERQWSALTSWAAEKGVLLSPSQVETLRRGREGGGEEHFRTGAVITDAKPSNVIRGRDGSVWPFDVVVESTGILG